MPSFVHRLTTAKTVEGGNVVVATLPLPAGDYIVTAKAELRGFNTVAQADCQARLVVGSQQDETLRRVHKLHDPDDLQQIHLVVGANLTAPTNAQLICSMGAFKVIAAGVVITADLVQSLTITEAVGDPAPPPPPEN